MHGRLNFKSAGVNSLREFYLPINLPYYVLHRYYIMFVKYYSLQIFRWPKAANTFPRGHKLEIQRSLDLLFFLFYSLLWTSASNTIFPQPRRSPVIAYVFFFYSHHI